MFVILLHFFVVIDWFSLRLCILQEYSFFGQSHLYPSDIKGLRIVQRSQFGLTMDMKQNVEILGADENQDLVDGNSGPVA